MEAFLETTEWNFYAIAGNLLKYCSGFLSSDCSEQTQHLAASQLATISFS
jgi:hypothetical protein